VQTTGKTLYIDGGTGSGDVFTAGETALVVGRITVEDAGDDTFDVWMNPDVSGGEAGLGAVTRTRTGAFFSAAGITTIAIISYASGAAPPST
jgi:tripartite-type tricarboxylate transporter receptor subunit TctC